MAVTLERRSVPQQQRRRTVLEGRRIPVWLYGFASMVIVLLSLLQFHSWISLEQAASVDPRKNPFATPFYIVNIGNVSLHKVSLVCDYLSLTKRRIIWASKLTESLTFKKRVLLPCTASIAENPESYRGTTFTLTVNYRVGWSPLRRSQTFRLKSAALADGTYLWLQEK